MRDVIWTIIIVWLVYKIYNAFKGSKTYVFNKHEHHHHYEKEGSVKIDPNTIHSNTKKSNNKGEGEYVDYEEIK